MLAYTAPTSEWLYNGTDGTLSVFAKAWEQLSRFLLSVVCSCGSAVQILKASKLHCVYNGSVKEPYGESADTKT